MQTNMTRATGIVHRRELARRTSGLLVAITALVEPEEVSARDSAEKGAREKRAL